TVAEQIKFLRAIPPMCFHAQKIGRDTLEPPGSKAVVAQRIAELLEALPLDSGPSSILSSSLVAVGNLSKLQPALEQELESRLLQAGMSRIFPMDTAKDLYIQSLHKSLEEKLDMMLRGLLTTSPSTDHLQHTLEHIGFWIRSTNTTERARAMRTSTALLRYTSLLPGFDSSSEFPRMGHLVAELGLSITDPAEDIARQAKAGIYWLYRLLLHRRGLSIHEAEELWSRDVPQDSRLLAYVNTARVGQVFGKIFSEGQRRSFQQTALLATHHPLLRLSQAGLLLTYALLGEADQLLGDTVSSWGRGRDGGSGPFPSGPGNVTATLPHCSQHQSPSLAASSLAQAEQCRGWAE
ncbi:maestro heat-like repeat-containing protein family member 7, partial [Emydura macquarii macquarii]|uniref:maestro heat-like repeat-containing protein family member 7 n=1 Tax=Emydura macquarii macquarii TaxID=1129001 RepID=UPI00352A86B2